MAVMTLLFPWPHIGSRPVAVISILMYGRVPDEAI